MKIKVLIPTKLSPVAKQTLVEHGYEVVQDEATPLVDLAAKHPDAGALIVRSERVTAEVIDSLPSLRVIVRAGAGYNTIDIKHARKKGVDVMNTPGANSNAVAEEVVAMMLAVARHIVEADRSTREGKWEKSKFMGTELAGKTVGILGLGHVGQLVARRLSGFDVRLLGYDPLISSERAEELGVELASPEEIFARSDYVTLHIPENESTRGWIDRKLLSLMKPGACLVNCARSAVVNEDELRAVKAEKRILFATDVYPKDEPGPKSVADIADLMLPHLGASTREANENAARRAAQFLIDLLEKGVTKYVVNLAVPPGLDVAYQRLANTVARLGRAYLGPTKQLKQIETSFYGDLGNYSRWLLGPVVAGISQDFEATGDFEEAKDYLQRRGITWIDREVDNTKGYGKSITVDLIAGTSSLDVISIRGTIAENTEIIARIGEFDKLYFQLAPHTVIFVYPDRPGALAKIATALAENDINIDDTRVPHNPKGDKSIALIKVNKPVSPELVAKISRAIDAEKGFYVKS